MRTMGGAGGYGGISTMNQDQRQPRYMPHVSVSMYTRLSDNTTEVSCYGCGQKWSHPRGARANTPSECSKNPMMRPVVTEDNEVIWVPETKP